MNKHLIIFLLAMVGTIPAIAQNEDSFEAYRKGIKDSFHTFQKKLLDDYDKYLEGVWTKYDAFRGEERSPLPKPRKAPLAENAAEQPSIIQIPVPSKPEPETLPSDKKPDTSLFTSPVIPTQDWDSFDFYSISVKVPDVRFKDNSGLFRTKDFAVLWRAYSDNKIAKKVIPALQQCAARCNLNDWFIFDLVRSYVDHVFATAEPEMRISLRHYLLSHWGYDVRIGIEDTEQPILLAAIVQMVYARTYTEIDGQRYYLFHDSRYNEDTNRNISFRTCELPSNAEKGYPIDLIIHKELTIPYLPHPYTFNYGGLAIKGEVNANLMPMLYHYPQMPIGCYAQSIVNKNIHNEVVEQLHRQLTGMPQQKAVDTLLHFVQSAFEYATDDEQHGFEKPYFFEEVLFYPQCDCEDRSIFYAYLLWHVLGVENQLIGYPGHEAVAVHLNTPIQGDGYSYNDRTFYISDPTYIGAVTGMCMPDYRNEQPEIEFYYLSKK